MEIKIPAYFIAVTLGSRERARIETVQNPCHLAWCRWHNDCTTANNTGRNSPMALVSTARTADRPAPGGTVLGSARSDRSSSRRRSPSRTKSSNRARKRARRSGTSAHTTWFFERFVLGTQQPGYEVVDDRYEHLFNSYYYTVGAMHPRGERGLLSRPTVAQIHDYRSRIDDAIAGVARVAPATMPTCPRSSSSGSTTRSSIKSCC